MAAMNEDPQLRIRTAPPRSASPARQRLQITVPRVQRLAMQMGSPRTQRNQLNSPRAQKLQMSSYLSPVTQGAYITLVLAEKLTHFSGAGMMTCPAYWLVSDEKFIVIRPVEDNSWLRPYSGNAQLTENEYSRNLEEIARKKSYAGTEVCIRSILEALYPSRCKWPLSVQNHSLAKIDSCPPSPFFSNESRCPDTYRSQVCGVLLRLLSGRSEATSARSSVRCPLALQRGMLLLALRTIYRIEKLVRNFTNGGSSHASGQKTRGRPRKCSAFLTFSSRKSLRE